MDTSLLWDVFWISPQVKTAIEKFNNNTNEIVIDTELYNNIQSILVRAKINSESSIFHSAVDSFLEELNYYKGKTAIEIHNLLNASS